MKQLSFILIASSLLLTGCSKHETIITGQITGDIKDKTFVYTAPISGTSFMGFQDTLKLNETGKFELKFEIDQAAFVSIGLSNLYEKQVKLLIEPGGNYHVDMDMEKETQISGTNEKGQMLYATLPNPEIIQLSIRPFRADTSAIQIHEDIEKLKQADLEKFQALYDKKEISSAFFKLLQTDRDCYYASTEAMTLIAIQLFRFNDLLKNEEDVFKNLERIYEQYPPNQENLLSSTFWGEYAQRYIVDYNQAILLKDYTEKAAELNKKGIYRTFVIDESKKYLTGKALEFFQAYYIGSDVFQFGDMDKELITLFEQFQKEYPNSQYSKYLAPPIDKIVQFHQIAKQSFSEEMKFLDDYAKINTLEEAIKPLQGKKIYIDVWATWCAPCRAEFANNEALKKILAENDIQQLYISIDKDNQEQQWFDMIKYYGLTGTHIRANKSFHNELLNLYDKKNPQLYIPWYILVDENGNIIEEHAKSPSQLVAGEKLIAD